MAISGADTALLNRVLTTTLDRYSSTISNEIARNDGVVAVFGADGSIKVKTGGQRAIETIDKGENPNFSWKAYTADVDTDKADTRQQAKYAWAHFSGSVTNSDIERAMNSGDSQIYDMIEADIMNAGRTIIRGVADALRAASPGAYEPESVLSIIQDAAVASQTGSVGEIARNQTYWFNQYSNTSMDLSANSGYEALTAFMVQSCAKGTSKMEKPNFGLTNGTLFAALLAQAENNRRFTSDAKMAELGFDSVVVNGMRIIADPAFTAGDLYLINTRHMFIQVLKTPNMKNVGERPQSIPISTEPFRRPYNNLHTVSLMHVTMALTCSSLQRQGIATNCS